MFSRPLSLQKLFDFFLALTIPWFPAARASAKVGGRKLSIPMITLTVLFHSFIILNALQEVESELMYFSLVILMGYFAYVTAIRTEVRQTYHIQGNMFQDFLIVMFLHPFAVDQLQRQTLYDHAKNDEIDGAEMNDFNTTNSLEMEEKETFLKKA